MWHGKGIVAVIIFDEFHQPFTGDLSLSSTAALTNVDLATSHASASPVSSLSSDPTMVLLVGIHPLTSLAHSCPSSSAMALTTLVPTASHSSFAGVVVIVVVGVGRSDDDGSIGDPSTDGTGILVSRRHQWRVRR